MEAYKPYTLPAISERPCNLYSACSLTTPTRTKKRAINFRNMANRPDLDEDDKMYVSQEYIEKTEQ